MATWQLPTRLDELRMLEKVGVVTSELVERQMTWTLVPDALERIARWLAS